MTSIRVLLVDDVSAFRKLVAVALRMRGGFDVVAEAANGAMAATAAEQHQPDVVVLDLGLPDLAGTEVIQLIRDCSPKSKIVVFSGRDYDGDSMRAVEGFVRKTVDVQLLVDVLMEVASERAPVAASLALGCDLDSAARARRFVEARCEEWGLDAVVDDALLIVSELVTNAVLHASSDSELRLAPARGVLRIEVEDAGTTAPDPKVAGETDEHGRGLLLISLLSAAWGTEASARGGKVIWADLPTGRPSDRVA